jgi:hypothetical protein
MVPGWLHVLAIVALLLGFGSAALIAFDEIKHPQPMWIMNVVWPVTALYAGPLCVWGYFRYGRAGPESKSAHGTHAKSLGAEQPSFRVMTAKATTHCGSGCVVGDIIAEWLVFAFPVIAVWFGYGAIFSEMLFAVWIVDFLFAFSIGVAFQYFTIAPMRNLSVRDGLIAALKADSLSLTAWQVGMYGFMALAQFYIFRRVLGSSLEVNSPEFWFMMQIAMIAGFITSYPVNGWLLRIGLKEEM